MPKAVVLGGTQEVEAGKSFMQFTTGYEQTIFRIVANKSVVVGGICIRVKSDGLPAECQTCLPVTQLQVQGSQIVSQTIRQTVFIDLRIQSLDTPTNVTLLCQSSSLPQLLLIH